MNTNNLINVNIDTRQVVIPNNFTLGVENDNSCSKIGFLVPKKSDITDISDLTFKINTLSARGTADIIECEVAEQDDYFIITADLKGTIFECNGKAIINLCGCKYDDNNNIIKKWGTEDIVVMVGAHTDAEKAIEQLYPSVLEELRKKIDASKVTEEQLNTIAQKVAEKGFYTKSEVDSLINAKPTLTVDTELNETSNNPIANKAVFSTLNTMSANFESELAEKADKTELETYATTNDLDKKADKFTIDTELKEDSNNPVANSAVYKSFNTVNSNIQLMFKNVNDNINGLTDDLDDKADKTALPTKLSDLADDTEHRTVTDAEKAKWNSNTGTGTKEWTKVGECSDVTQSPTVSLSKPCTEIIAIGSGLKGSGSSQVLCYVADGANISANINGVNGGLRENIESTYMAELKVIEGVGIKGMIRSDLFSLSTCSTCFSTFVEASIGAIEKVELKSQSFVTLTSGSFIVYGR